MNQFVSLFSGAGGLDLGLELAGWDCRYATDNDADAIATLEANQGFGLGQGRRFLDQAIVEQRDVRLLSGKDLLQRISLARGEIELLAGGPPCQAWSSGGLQMGFDDPRGQLIEHYLRVAEELDPRMLLFENVRGLLTARGKDGTPGSALGFLRHELLRRGWQSRVALLNAADFGVAQRRVRLILIGHRQGDHLEFPPTTHSEGGEGRLKRWLTLGECLSQLHPLDPDEIIRPSGKMASDLAELAPGTGAKSPGKRETTRPGGHWGYKQGAFIADLERSARTVTASAQQDWIRDPKLGLRRLSPRECAAIQTFPPKWHFAGNRASQYRLIGNAVPPQLGSVLGKTIGQIRFACADERSCLVALAPLPERLQSAISYTIREDRRNGESRRLAAIKRPMSRRASAV